MSRPAKHEGLEWIYVIDGELVLMTGEERLHLGGGHAVQFDASLPHQTAAQDSVRVLIISATTPGLH